MDIRDPAEAGAGGSGTTGMDTSGIFGVREANNEESLRTESVDGVLVFPPS